MAELRLDGGDPAGALPYAERSLASGASVEQLLEARVMLARLALALGQPAEASAHAAEAVAQAERLGSPRLLSLAHLAAGRAAAAAGDPRAAEAAPRSGDSPGRGGRHPVRARARARRRGRAAARGGRASGPPR